MSEVKTVQKVGMTAVTLPSYIKAGDRAGVEDVLAADIKLPRLALAQDTTPQRKKTNPKYIEGLVEGAVFNDLSGEVYGEGPIEVVFAHAFPARYMELIPMEDGGGIKDRDVKAGDPRTQWGADGEKPVATKFLDFAAVLVETREPIAVSFKNAGLKHAVFLNGLVQNRLSKFGVPLQGTVYALTPTLETNKAGKEYYVLVPRVSPNFPGDVAGLAPEELYLAARALHEAVKGKALASSEADAVSDPDAPGAEKF